MFHNPVHQPYQKSSEDHDDHNDAVPIRASLQGSGSTLEEAAALAIDMGCVSAVLVVAVPPFLIALVAVNIGWNLLVTTFVLLPALTCFAPCAQLGRDVSGSHAME